MGGRGRGAVMRDRLNKELLLDLVSSRHRRMLHLRGRGSGRGLMLMRRLGRGVEVEGSDLLQRGAEAEGPRLILDSVRGREKSPYSSRAAADS